MEQLRTCLFCGANLVGPFAPEITLTPCSGAGEGTDPTGEPSVAHAWRCPDCGLVAWYTNKDLGQANDSEDESLAAQPGLSYERRTQMLRMLRRVRRM